MDAAALRMRIQSTLDPNADVRGRAEIDLKYVSATTPLCHVQRIYNTSNADLFLLVR